MTIRQIAAAVAVLALIGTAFTPAFADTMQNQKGNAVLDDNGNPALDEFGNPITYDPNRPS